MSDSNRYSYSQSRRVTITLHPLYGGAGGNRTRVRNSYMNKTFLRNRRFFSVAFQRALAIPSNLSQGAQWFAHLHHLVSFSSNKENCAFGRIFTSYIHPSSRYVVLESTVNQAATLSATKAAKAGWIITTVSELSFHFLYAFRRSSTCESCTLKTPSNPLRPHMKLSKCLCVVGAERIELPT